MNTYQLAGISATLLGRSLVIGFIQASAEFFMFVSTQLSELSGPK